jgi:hypothetical protein
MSNSTNHEERVNRVKQLLELRMSQMQSYHNHKETMAHAALLVALAVSGAVISASSWPPSWVPSLSISNKVVTILIVTGIWLLIHVYMRWQLRNRRLAAQYVACLLKVLRDWAITPPTEEDLKPYMDTMTGGSKFISFVDFFVPLKSTAIPLVEGLQGYPAAMVAEYFRTTSDAFWAERLVSYGSVFLWFLILARTLF